jgi:hypothetical protein
MRKINLVLLTIFMALFATGIVPAQINHVEGRWENIKPGNEGITSIVITYNGARVIVHAWGRCVPNDCDWGETPAYAYGNNAKSDVVTSANTLIATYSAGSKETILLIRLAARDRIQVESFIRFTDNTGETAYHARDVFVRTGLETGVMQECLTYNPHNLRIVDEGSDGWLLTDGLSRMNMLDNRRDAERALALARRHTAHCFIGRDKTSANRRGLIVEYWTGASGIPSAIKGEDCLSYRLENLRIVEEAVGSWLLTDGRSRMVMLADKEDAERALSLARKNSQHCFIGRDNTRPNRLDYILGYWQ